MLSACSAAWLMLLITRQGEYHWSGGMQLSAAEGYQTVLQETDACVDHEIEAQLSPRVRISPQCVTGRAHEA